MGKLIDLTGNRFERLTVIERAPNRNKKIYWRCKCDCGNETFVQSSHLKSGKVKSCGCLKKEKLSELAKNQSSNFIDLTGKNFGKLTVLKRDNNYPIGKKVHWICRCECGQTVSVDGQSLRRGESISCGCIRQSKGEYLISKILDENNIPYKREVTFPDLKDKSYLRYDFAILNEQKEIIKLIEFDGKQHYSKDSFWYSEDLVKKDLIKNNYAKNNKIPLLRISYKDIDKISLEYLLS